MAVRGTHVQLKIDGQSRNFWNHDSARLFEFLGATGGQVRAASGERKDTGAPVLLMNGMRSTSCSGCEMARSFL